MSRYIVIVVHEYSKLTKETVNLENVKKHDINKNIRDRSPQMQNSLVVIHIQVITITPTPSPHTHNLTTHKHQNPHNTYMQTYTDTYTLPLYNIFLYMYISTVLTHHLAYCQDRQPVSCTVCLRWCLSSFPPRYHWRLCCLLCRWLMKASGVSRKIKFHLNPSFCSLPWSYQ